MVELKPDDAPGEVHLAGTLVEGGSGRPDQLTPWFTTTAESGDGLLHNERPEHTLQPTALSTKSPAAVTSTGVALNDRTISTFAAS